MNMIENRMLLNALLRRDFGSFLRKTFAEVSPGDQLKWNWHLDALNYRLMEVRDGRTTRLIVNVPPRSLKSITVSVAFVAWCLGHDPSLKFICVSYAHDLAEDLGRQCLKVMQSAWYRQIFPGTRLERSKCSPSYIVTTRRGSRLATSIDGSLTGFGADIIIIDDPIKADAGLSEAERTKVNRWYDGTLSTRLNDKINGRILLVMQRLHMEDLTAHVLEKEPWDHLVLPAIAQQTGAIAIGPHKAHVFKAKDLLHADRENEVVMERTKRIMGTLQFGAQYLQEPAPLTGNLVRRRWFKTYILPPDRESGELVISWDTAAKANELSDYSVGTVWLVRYLEEGKWYYLLDIVREQLEYPDLRKRVLDLRDQWKPSTILIEDTASGQQLIPELRLTGAEVIAIRPEGDKVMRFVPQTAVIEQGRVFVPETAPWLDDFYKELLQFPNSRHDDQVDSVSQFLKWAETRTPMNAW